MPRRRGDRVDKPTLTAGGFSERLMRRTISPRTLSIHLSIYGARLHDVQRDQTRKTLKVSRPDATRNDSTSRAGPHSSIPGRRFEPSRVRQESNPDQVILGSDDRPCVGPSAQFSGHFSSLLGTLGERAAKDDDHLNDFEAGGATEQSGGAAGDHRSKMPLVIAGVGSAASHDPRPVASVRPSLGFAGAAVVAGASRRLVGCLRGGP